MMKHKYKYGNGLAYYEGKDVAMLEEMAAKGYAFVKVNGLGFYKFRKAQPEECMYSIDFADVSKKNKDFQQYVEIFEAGGWEYVTSMENIHYFKAPKGTKPIYTDGGSMAEKYDNMRKICVRSLVVGGIFTAICIALYAVLQWYFLIPLAGVGIGLGVVMYQGVEMNKLRAARLRNGAGLDDDCPEVYEAMSRSCRRALLWSLLLIVVVAALLVLRILDVLPAGGSAVGGIVGAAFGLGFANAVYQGAGYFSYRRKASRAADG